MSGKELADKVGLSQSQMSRLESGQRRIDTGLLSKLARVFSVNPSHFFPDFRSEPEAAAADSAPTDAPVIAAEPIEHAGKVIRAERRRRHMRAEELGQKVGKGKTWVLDVEGGALDLLSGELMAKLARALKLDVARLMDAQRASIRELQQRLQRTDRAYADRTRGLMRFEDGQTRSGLPLLNLGEAVTIGDDGLPAAEVQDYIHVPDLAAHRCFAVLFLGDEMRSSSAPSFEEGDVLVFTTDRDVRHRELALAVTGAGAWHFRQVFFDPRGAVRLQPLNFDYAPTSLHRDEVAQLYRLVARLQRF